MLGEIIKPDRFKPAQPRIPGLPEPASQERKAESPDSPPPVAAARSLPIAWIAGAGSAVLLLALFVALWNGRKAQSTGAQPVPTTDLPAAAPPPPPPAVRLPTAPGFIATTEELAKPWAVKKFVFVNPNTNENILAMVVHLPGGAFWAFSLQEPFGKCELEYETDLRKLRSEYNHVTNHPMVTDPCNHSVFDLSRYGNGPNGLVRGDVVEGPAIRPPLAIEVRVDGHRIRATRIE